MSKAIIVTEMYKSCDDCPSCIIGSCTFCGVNGRKIDQIEIVNESKKPDWCPRKEMPEKMKYHNGTYNGHVKGWNLCIDEMLKAQ